MSEDEPHDTENLDEKTEILFRNEELLESSGEEPSMEQWSSLIIPAKRSLVDSQENLQFEAIGEICATYLRLSDSSVYRHPYYSYPAVLDPGIKSALLDPKPKRPPFPDDGYELYMALCEEHNVCPTRLFYSNLFNSEINVSYYCSNSANFRMMAIALQRNKHVKRFDLTDNYLDIDACYHLGQMIKTNTTLQELVMDGCRMKEVGLRNVAENIQSNFSIDLFSVARNDLGDEGGQLFADVIGKGANFRRVNLSYNNLGEKTAMALNDALEIRNILTHIDISWNPLVHVASAVKFLSTLAVTSNTLVELNLSFMGFDNERVATAIAEVTLVPTLKILNLSNNRFDDASAPLLIAKLKKSNLHTYDLSNNVFTLSGACTILSKLRQPEVTLRKLLLDNICVNKQFMVILERVRKMKSRKHFVVTFDKVLHDWVAIGDDPRRLILRRGEYMGRMKKKAPKDVPMFLLSLSYAAEHLRAKELIVMMKDQKIPTNDDWVDGLTKAFPGPLIDKKPTVDSVKMREFIRRLWPDLKLPPDWTPPIMIRVDVKRKKVIQKSKSRLAIGKKKK